MSKAPETPEERARRGYLNAASNTFGLEQADKPRRSKDGWRMAAYVDGTFAFWLCGHSHRTKAEAAACTEPVLHYTDPAAHDVPVQRADVPAQRAQKGLGRMTRRERTTEEEEAYRRGREDANAIAHSSDKVMMFAFIGVGILIGVGVAIAFIFPMYR